MPSLGNLIRNWPEPCHILSQKNAHLSLCMSSMIKRQAIYLGAFFSCHWTSWDKTHQRAFMSEVLVTKYDSRHQLGHYILSICAQSKVHHTFLADKLVPLPMPQWLWSHLSLNSIPDLPESPENTVILVIMDRGLRSLQFIPLPGLSLAFRAGVGPNTPMLRTSGCKQQTIC